MLNVVVNIMYVGIMKIVYIRVIIQVVKYGMLHMKIIIMNLHIMVRFIVQNNVCEVVVKIVHRA